MTHTHSHVVGWDDEGRIAMYISLLALDLETSGTQILRPPLMKQNQLHIPECGIRTQ